MHCYYSTNDLDNITIDASFLQLIKWDTAETPRKRREKTATGVNLCLKDWISVVMFIVNLPRLPCVGWWWSAEE